MAIDNEILEQGIQDNLPSLESFLKTILLKKISAEMSASSEADTAMVIEALKTGTAVVKAHDDAFDLDVYVAYDENWIPQLSMAMLGVEENDLNEISQDLIKEFSSQLFGNIQVTLREQGIPFEPGDVNLVKSGQITNSVAEGDYFMAQVDVSGKFEIEGDEQPHLAMILAFAVPEEDKVKEVMGEEEEEEDTAPAEEEEQAATEEEEMSADDIDAAFEDDDEEDLEADDEDDEDEFDDEPEEEQPAAKKKKKAAKKAEEIGDERQKEAQKGKKVKGKKVDFEDFSQPKDGEASEARNLNLLKDVELDISVELGRRNLPLGDILHLVKGSVVELNKLAGEPVEVYANGHQIAEGEVVVIDEHFGVRITNLVSTKERIESLR